METRSIYRVEMVPLVVKNSNCRLQQDESLSEDSLWELEHFLYHVEQTQCLPHEMTEPHLLLTAKPT
jgi:hypothetical protein